MHEEIARLPPLRQGHKMLLSGSSKAGKPFLLMELCIAIAEGRSWLGFPCKQGRVLYINLEIDPTSCLNGVVTLKNMAIFMNVSERCLRIWIQVTEDYYVDRSVVIRR